MERKTYRNRLEDAVNLIMVPIRDFHSLIGEETEGEIGKIMRVFEELLIRQDQEFERIYEAINRTLGPISLEYPMHKEYVELEGRTFKDSEIIRAILTPVEPQAAAQGGE